MNSLSIIIITFNEEKNLARTLESARFADEIVVLDSGSTDETVNIAKKYTDKVYQQNWLGFGPQKNKAIDYATADWVLVLSADEVIDQTLAHSIQYAINNTTKQVAYKFKRQGLFCGKWIKHGDWRNDWVLRLFRRNQARYDDAPIHESLRFNGRINKLSGILYHYTQGSIEISLNKMNAYSSLAAQHLLEKKRKTSVYNALINYWWTFFRCYVLKAGFLDGRHGFLLAQLMALGSYMKYIKVVFHKGNTPN